MLFLQYGVDADGQLIEISQIGRGKTTLHCPYCGGLLLARKGERLAHHFAHMGETCHSASRDMEGLSLPAYDHFNFHLPGRAVKELAIWSEHRWSWEANPHYLEEHGLLKESDYKEGWFDLTKKGKIVLGQLSLDLFNQFQEPLILERHAKIEANVRGATTDVDRLMYITDLRLYRTQVRRILSCTLYFLQIGTENLYKIGITTRPIDERIQEIMGDVKPLLGDVEIKVLGTWSSRGNVEYYFKHRYHPMQHPLSNLTEYYQFEDVKPVLRDLRRMKPKILSDLEQEIVNGRKSQVELEWESACIEQRRVAGIKPGLERARANGKRLGRPPGKEGAEAILTKPYVDRVRQALAAGLSLRDAAHATGVSTNTVQKVKAALTTLPESSSSPTLLTRADLPDKPLPALWKYAATKYQKQWNKEWPFGKVIAPRQLETDGAYFVPGYSCELYFGKTRREVINNILYILNTGKDDPVKRLHLTHREFRILDLLNAVQAINRQRAVIEERDKSAYARLVFKRLVSWNDFFRAYVLSIAAQRLLDGLHKKHPSQVRRP